METGPDSELEKKKKTVFEGVVEGKGASMRWNYGRKVVFDLHIFSPTGSSGEFSNICYD